MAAWVTHLMIADGILERLPQLDRRGFCVGNIAPDCNVENADWTAFTPPRSVTHWMQGNRKKAADADVFCEAYLLQHRDEVPSPEEYAFLLGYYSHLITDAAFQAMVRNEARIRAVWGRIHGDANWNAASAGMEETWDSVKRLVPKPVRMGEIATLEALYLHAHPDSGYLTEILPLQSFPDYIDYLPHGAIVRKVKVMGTLPEVCTDRFLTLSQEEYSVFVADTIQLVLHRFAEKGLLSVL